jgi:hypothetical protein
MNARAKALLIGAYRDLKVLLEQPWHQGRDMWRENAAKRDALDGIVAINPGKWLGEEVTNSGSTMNARAYAALQAAGLVKRVANDGSNKLWGLRFTEAGVAEAERLIAAEDPAFRSGLSQTAAVPGVDNDNAPPERTRDA